MDMLGDVMPQSDAQRSGDRSLLRRMNSHAALVALRRGSLTLTSLSEALGLSRTAVEEVIRDLESRGWVEEASDTAQPERSIMGRPAKYYSFAAGAGRLAGVDIGANKVLAIVTDLAGTVLGSARGTVDENDPLERRLDAANRALRSAAKKSGSDIGALWCVGVGTPGSITPAGVIRRYGGTGMPGWAGLDLAGALHGRWGVPVVVDGDSNLGLLAEHWVGVAQDARQALFVLSGHRTGSGILIDGKLYHGATGATGLIGELPELGWARIPEVVESMSQHGIEPTREALFLAASEGNPDALAAVETIAQLLARGMAALILALDPELVVLGGGLSRAGDLLLAPLVSQLELLHAAPSSIAVSVLGDESVALGAIRIALDRVDASLRYRVEHGASIGSPDASLGVSVPAS
jgi:predicted NBD/HSP70 family sugar kinase